MKNEDLFSTAKWQEEIISKSKNWRDISFFSLGICIIVFLVITGALIVFFPKDDSPLQICNIITINSFFMKILGAIASTIGVLYTMSIIHPLKEWSTPRRCYYRGATVIIIDDLKNKNSISGVQHCKLLDIAVRVLGPLENGASQADHKETLERACNEMVDLLKIHNSNGAT